VELLEIAAIGLRQGEERLAAISQNIANVATAGYKRQIAVTGSFAGHVGALSSATHDTLSSTAVDRSAGALRSTGRSMDVAIEGESFFEVLTPQGPAFTRQGSFHLDVQGRLVNGQGLPVSGQSGEISLLNKDFSVLGNGEIHQDGRLVGKLKLVRFDRTADLAPLGQGMYKAAAGDAGEIVDAPRLRIGFQEASNVNTADEMVRLTGTVRSFEALHKVVQGYDESLEKAIRKLGEF
jgi:flagellar basal-body rod protein FlgF